MSEQLDLNPILQRLHPDDREILPQTLAVFKVAYFREFGNLVATQGQSIIMSVTLAKPKQ